MEPSLAKLNRYDPGTLFLQETCVNSSTHFISYISPIQLSCLLMISLNRLPVIVISIWPGGRDGGYLDSV